MKHIKGPIRRLTKLSTRRIAMSKASKARQLMTLCMSMLLVIAGSVITAPTASANDVTATVFDTPEVRYVNVRDGAGLEHKTIGKVEAGGSVTLTCWKSGSSVPSPFAGYPASTIWYKVDGYEYGWVSDAYISTGSDAPVTPPCQAFDLFKPKKALTNPVYHYVSVKWTLGGNGHHDPNVATSLYRHYLHKEGTPGADTYIDWAYFSEHQPFVNFACSIPVGEVRTYEAVAPKDDIFMYLALHNIDVYRTSEHEFVVTDYYDFDQAYLFGTQYQMAQNGSASEFNVFSGGSLAGKRTTDGTAFTC